MRTFEAIALALAGLAAAAAPATAGASEILTFSYDSRGRLVKVEHDGAVNANVVTRYSYDKADNRTAKTVTDEPALCLVMPPGELVPIPIPRCGA